MSSEDPAGAPHVLSRHLTALLDLLPHAVYEAVFPAGRAAEAQLVFVSERGRRMGITPVSRDQPPRPASELMELVHPDDRAALAASMASDADSAVVTYRVRLPDGSECWLESRSYRERLANGNVLTRGTLTDVTDMRQLQSRLREQRQRLRVATYGGGVASWELTLEAGVPRLIWDEKMYDLIGADPASPLDPAELWRQAMHPDDGEAFDRFWSDVVGRRSAELEHLTRVVRLDTGEVRDIRGRGRLTYGPGDRVRGLGTNRDVTDERRVVAGMAAAKEAAEAAERAKGEFLAVMSHEIRTPLNAVLGMTHLALKTELTARQRGYLEKVELSTRSLMSIISDVLDFSKIEAGALELESGDVVVAELLESVAAVTVLRAEEKGLELVFRVGAEVPSVVLGDGLRLGQVVVNLVGNAVKFTDFGGVSVGVSGGAGSPLRVDVSDSGVGLSEGQLDRVFDAFSQADSAVTRTYGGTGLGLAICKRLVRMMGGEIWARSVPGEGSTFSFTVAAPRSPRAVQRPSDNSGLRGRRALVVDDNGTAATVLCEMLTGFGMVAGAADSGPAGLAALRSAALADAAFEVVLMDWRMPGMNGLEAARLVKADPLLAHTPAILMVTAYAREELLTSSERVGVDGVLLKPDTDSVMFNTLAHVLGLTGPRTDPQPRPHAEEAEIPSLIDRRVLVVDDNALNREVATELLAAAGMLVTVAGNGEQALARLAADRFDVVLMDLHMPGLDGLETTRRLRRLPGLAELPVVALTAEGGAGDPVEQAGMTAHLGKPIEERELLATLTRVLAGQPRPAPAASVPGLTASGRDRLARGFLRDFGTAPERLVAGLAGGAHGEAVRIAHDLKGTADYVGAGELARAAGALEQALRAGRPDPAPLAERTVRLLRDTLVRLDEAGLAAPALDPPVSAGADAAVPAVVARLLPLVAAGDYEAVLGLDELREQLAGGPHAGLAAAACDAFSDLDLATTAELLTRLAEQFDGSP